MALKWFKKKPAKDTQQEPKAPVADEAVQSPVPEQAEVREPSPAPAAPVAANQKGGLMARLKRGLAKTRSVLTTDIEDLFAGGRKLDEAMLEELEETLITADIGVRTTMDLIQRISKSSAKISSAKQLKVLLKEQVLALLEPCRPPEAAPAAKPLVMMVVGVNGVGKTTTIGKLAARFTGQGQKVLIAAADTFRAAAVEQLAIWAERAGAEIIKHRQGADPAAVVFDSMQAAVARGSDVVIVDTAGRLHTQVNLMEELKKIRRTLAKQQHDAPHETLLVLDATTGQNALSQAHMFHEAIGITGLALTKLDGTAKGGIVISICGDLDIPLRFIGVGEGIEDLQDFAPQDFVEALF